MSSSPLAFNGFDKPLSAPPSSPPMVPETFGSRKPKRPPPITPKRFTRFFTPRNTLQSSSGARITKSSRQLRDITRSALNRPNDVPRKSSSMPRKTVDFADFPEDGVVHQLETPAMSSRKRKKAYMSPETSPLQSSPSKRAREMRYATPPPIAILDEEAETVCEDEEPRSYPTRIRRLKSLGGPSRILQRSFGGSAALGRGLLRDSGSAWQHYTADFYSASDDFHQLPRGAPPFCTASCNTNDMIAVGDEDGYVTLLDADNEVDFSKAHISFCAHKNAIMDIQFSSDDMYIATGSGDQTAQIIDVRTQQTVHVLAKHKSSVKQVRFQPGDDKIVATSSRDGAVQIWDLRCKGGNNTVHSAWGADAPYASVIRTLSNAHVDSGHATFTNGTTSSTNPSKSSPIAAKMDTFSRRADISVTALSFLPTGRQHLLLTASDASTSVKLWDIRGRYSFRGPAVPISTTYQPESHNRHRHFAINSLTLSGDAARLYALSKDNTVYAYSVNHLILGNAPDLSALQTKNCSLAKDGLGPIYGFRHRNFHAGSFYVKASLRKASGDQPEVLAVGSTDGCPVLFPTDENLLKRETSRGEDDDDDDDDLPQLPPRSSGRPSLSARNSGSAGRFPSLLTDTIPIYEHGTPLIRGHDREVTSVAWARNGTLISVGDDCRVRHWKEGSQARDLRQSGEAEGRRWASGWAVVDEAFDDEDE